MCWPGNVIPPEGIDGLMKFAQGFAVPCLLFFRNIAAIDLATTFDPALLLSFYSGAVLCFRRRNRGARDSFLAATGKTRSPSGLSRFSRTRS